MDYRYLIFLLLALVAGCSSDSPEQQVRSVIAQMETAMEARDVSDLMEHIAADYRDAYGQGRQEAGRYAQGYFISNQSIHLLTRIESVEFPASDEARAKVLVGMAGREASGDSWDLVADVYEFQVTLLREDDEWKVTYAEWSRSR